jgi:hypothetical protein
MRTDIALTIGAGVAGFALCAYLVTYATTRHEPVEWQDGDLIFQTATTFPNQMILDATASPLTNVGVIAVTPEGPMVIEAGEKVDEISVENFVAKGTDGTISVYRVKNLTPEQAGQVVAAARRYLGKPYDTFFDKGSDNIYSGELVRLTFNGVGLTLGQMVRLDKLAKGLPAFESVFDQQWQSLRECQIRNYDRETCWSYVLKQQLVTPASIAADEHVALIFSDMASDQAALRPE